ncbi:hypothetical protein V3664_33135 [Streptomyces sp. CS62]
MFSSPHVGGRDPVMAVADVLVVRLRGADEAAELDCVAALWQAGWLESAGRVPPAAQPAHTDVWARLGTFGPVLPAEPEVPDLKEYVSAEVCATCTAPLIVPGSVARTLPLYCSTRCANAAARCASANTPSLHRAPEVRAGDSDPPLM